MFVLGRHMHCKFCYKIGCLEIFYTFFPVFIELCFVNNCAIFFNVHYLLQGNRMPYNILAKIYSCLLAWGRDGNGGIHRESRVFPGKNLQCKTAVEQSPVYKQLYYSSSEYLGEACGIFNRYMVERPCFIDPSLQNETVVVWIESNHVPKRLVGDDSSCLHCSFCCFSVVIVYDRKYDPWNIFEVSEKQTTEVFCYIWNRVEAVSGGWIQTACEGASRAHFKMIMQYLLNDILFPWFIDGQTVLQKPFALYKLWKWGNYFFDLESVKKRHAPP